MDNARALKLKANSAEFETKLSDVRRLQKALETYINKNFYVERMTPVTMRRVIGRSLHHDVNLALRVGGRGVSFHFFSGQSLLTVDAQFDLELVRFFHQSMDDMIGLAEDLCKSINRLDSFKAFLDRFDVQ